MDTKPTYEELVTALRCTLNLARVRFDDRQCSVSFYPNIRRGSEVLHLRATDTGTPETDNDLLEFGWGAEADDGDPPTEWTEFPFPEKDPLPSRE